MKSAVLLVMLFTIAFSCRILPFILGRRLEKIATLKKLSTTFPICILILLVAHTLQVTHAAMPELIALCLLIVTHLVWRKVLLSMTIAITCQQLLIFAYN